ncbi:MAG: phosphate regulon sensor histidine kinase PhoR [Steroidobacteraceae bacterium]
MSASLWLLMARVAAGLAAGMVLGLAFGHPAAGVGVVLSALLAREYFRLRRVLRWQRSHQGADAPELEGDWGELTALIARLQRRKQYHKRRLMRLLRELRRSTAAIPDGVVALNPQGEILWFNRTAARLLQLRSRTDVGLRIENLVRQPEFIRYLRGGEFAQGVVVSAALDAELYLHIQLVPYGDGQSLMLVRDVTRQQRLEAMRKDFVANASHELRSPLTVIAGYLETLSQDPALEPGLAGPIAEMRRQSTRMTGIIEDLLSLSRLEASDGEAERKPIDMTAMIGLLLRDLVARIDPATTVQGAAQSSERLLGDEVQIHSACANLLDNAAKYTPVGGTISMRWWVDGAGGHFSVQDSGIGIGAEHIPRLTERFYRVDPGRSRATGGSGLGLAIVKHVLQRHGATLEISSTEGRGSLFTCHFPADRLVSGATAV